MNPIKARVRRGHLFRLLVLTLILGSGEALPHAAPYSEFRFDRIGVEDGLSNGSVNAISQDRTGFMWFGTEDGLNRYDGRNFVVYRHEPDNPNSLSSSNFGAIFPDGRGRLWLGTWGGGLNRLDIATGNFTRYALNPETGEGFRGSRIEFVFEDSEGDIWVGTESSGLNRYLSAEDRFQHFSHDPSDPDSLGSNSVKAIAESEDGRLWVGTDDGLFLFRPQAERFERQEMAGDRESGRERIRSIARSADGGLWVGTRGDGLKRLDLRDNSWTEFRHDPGAEDSLSENAVARVYEDSAGIVWVATYTSGLDRLDPKTGQFRNYGYTTEASEEGISFRRMDVIFEDRGGVLWFGTRGGGINKVPVRPKGFRNFRHEPALSYSLPFPTVRSISGARTADGEFIWVGTDGGGLARYDLAEQHFETYGPRPNEQGGLSDGRIWATLYDREGRLWAGAYAGGLHLLEDPKPPGTFRRFLHEPARADSISDDRVHALLEAWNGDIWVGTRRGLNRLQSLSPRGASFRRYLHDPDDPSSLSNDEITALMQDRSGKLWVGTRDGLNVMDIDTGAFIRYGFRPGDSRSLSSNHIMSLFQDDSDTVWVGTEDGGLHRYDGLAFERFPALARQFGGRVAGILADRDGRLWLGGGRGLVRLDPEAGNSRGFDASDGLRTLSFLRGAAYVASTGEMFFGGLRGMVSFQPEKVHEKTDPPVLTFTSITRFDQGVPIVPEQTAEGALITLEHDAAFLRFEFAALDYLDTAVNQYAHKMDGIDQDWIDIGNQNIANYSGLMPGKYTFRVRASNSDGIWNEDGISVRVIITPPYWQTWWFRVLAVVLSGLLLYGLYVLRVRAISARNLQLERLNRRLGDQMAERNRVEGEREALIAELEARNAEMERFTYTVSHDLKSPLITILGFLGMLREDYDAGKAERVHSDLDKIEAATANMNQLLDELLQLSRAGKVIDDPKEVPLREIVDDVLSLASGEIGERGVEVTVHADLPVVRVDRGRFTEALLNLVSNAVRFMGTQLHPKIEIGVRREVTGPVYFVRDNGTGIEESHHQRIFGLFERLSPETPGTGIGLALVRRIIELHGGEVWVESKGPGTGSTFCFTLDTAGAERVREAASTASRLAS